MKQYNITIQDIIFVFLNTYHSKQKHKISNESFARLLDFFVFSKVCLLFCICSESGNIIDELVVDHTRKGTYAIGLGTFAAITSFKNNIKSRLYKCNKARKLCIVDDHEKAEFDNRLNRQTSILHNLEMPLINHLKS